jgi:hypothetical protein
MNQVHAENPQAVGATVQYLVPMVTWHLGFVQHCFVYDYLHMTVWNAVAQWLRYCATNRKVDGLIPDGVIGNFHRHNPSDHTMALGSTQPITEMSTRSISWG